MLEVVEEADIELENLSDTSGSDDSEECEAIPDEGAVRFSEADYRSPVEIKRQMSLSRGIFKEN